MDKTTDFDIPGIRIERAAAGSSGMAVPADQARPRPMLPNGREASDFSWFFRSILPELDAYYWLLDTAEGFRGLDEDTPSARRLSELLGHGPDKRNAESCVSPVDLFRHKRRLMTEIAPYVRDDWNSLYGFERLPANPVRIVELWNKDENQPAFLEQVDVFFENWDGAFWMFYTHQAALVEKVRNDLKDDPRVRIETESYRQTQAQCAGSGVIQGIASAAKRLLPRPRNPAS